MFNGARSVRVPSQFRMPAGCRLLLYFLIRSLRAQFEHILSGLPLQDGIGGGRQQTEQMLDQR